MLMAFSCTVSSLEVPYNTPFINSTETSKLDFDMTKEQVLKVLGEPLMVKSGTGDTKTIIWLYEVRTIEVLGEVERDFNTTSYKPRKYSDVQQHDDPDHVLQLEFINGKLKNWRPESKVKKRK